MEVAGATEIGVLLDGGLVSAPSRSLVTEAIGDDGGDALVGERADRSNRSACGPKSWVSSATMAL